MKNIVVIGASGTIGSAVVERFKSNNTVLSVGKESGQYNVDMTSEESIEALFDKIGAFDALIVAAGDVSFADFKEMTTEQWNVGIESKLMGQINLVRKAMPYINANGSITLTSGILTDEHIAWGTSASTINGAINHFVQAAANELPNHIRINAVSPTVVTESLPVYGDYFPGFESVSANKVANAFFKSAMGVSTGKIFEVFE